MGMAIHIKVKILKTIRVRLLMVQKNLYCNPFQLNIVFFLIILAHINSLISPHIAVYIEKVYSYRQRTMLRLSLVGIN